MMESQSHEQVINEINNVGTNNVHSQAPGNTTDGSNVGQMFNLSESMSSSPMNLPAASINRGRSKVWNQFAVTGDGKKVTCRQCGDSLSYSHSHSTSSMLKHLKRKHNMDLYPHAGDEDRFEPSPQVKLQEKLTKKSMKSKKVSVESLHEEVTSTEPSIQHDPLVFADPCVRMRWADHSDTFLKNFSLMYNDESYTDCTLVTKERQFFKGHRVILSSASSLFDEMFKMTPLAQHPIIFLNDVKAMELRILLDFIYKGEVSIPPSLIPGLVKVGGELKVKGLCDFVWNDQLASSIFQSYQSTEKSQHVQQQQQAHSSTVENTTTHNNYTTAISNSMIARKVLNTVRPAMKLQTTSVPTTSTFTYVPDKSAQLPTVLPGSTKTYARLVSNVRPVNALSSQQNNGVNVGDSSSFFNQSSGLKRIRIVTSAALPTTKATTMSNSSKFINTQTSDIGMECDQGPDTVLMVTNQGDTVLSTSQGGVTVMTPNSLPMGISVKDERCMDPHNTHHQFQNDHLNTHPITILSGCGGENTQDLDEVVYSITEVPGGGHEVLMTDGIESESIVLYESACGESQEKKLFHLGMQKH